MAGLVKVAGAQGSRTGTPTRRPSPSKVDASTSKVVQEHVRNKSGEYQTLKTQSSNLTSNKWLGCRPEDEGVSKVLRDKLLVSNASLPVENLKHFTAEEEEAMLKKIASGAKEEGKRAETGETSKKDPKAQVSKPGHRRVGAAGYVNYDGTPVSLTTLNTENLIPGVAGPGHRRSAADISDALKTHIT